MTYLVLIFFVFHFWPVECLFFETEMGVWKRVVSLSYVVLVPEYSVKILMVVTQWPRLFVLLILLWNKDEGRNNLVVQMVFEKIALNSQLYFFYILVLFRLIDYVSIYWLFVIRWCIENASYLCIVAFCIGLTFLLHWSWMVDKSLSWMCCMIGCHSEENQSSPYL